MAAASSRLIPLLESPDRAVRDRALEAVCGPMEAAALLEECEALDRYRRETDNLYRKVRALFFLYALLRFHLPPRLENAEAGRIPFAGYEHLLQRRFNEAIESFRGAVRADGMTDALASALSKAYYQLGLQYLADQVRRSVRSVRGNQWMFRTGHPADFPLVVRPELLERAGPDAPYPVLRERTAVRMDLSHSAWSDIFFLGMDFPEGARVLNVSINLAVRGRDERPEPPVGACLRVIDAPVLRLCSVDLGATVEIAALDEVFDFARDYLGLLKAALIASGIVPIGMEGSGRSLAELLRVLVGPGRGLELVSEVNGIPKGSRLAVSTNLLGALIAACMRATGQTAALEGPLEEADRRIVAARAILGEWLGGSGGGWQDSGGLWPGIKIISGTLAEEGDPEHGISRGCLLPRHHLVRDEVSADTRRKLQDSLVLVHGGMAQNVGPILEMVTEKYLLRSEREWAGRAEALVLFDRIFEALRDGDIRGLGRLTTENFFGPLQTIIPWATTFYTERLIEAVREEFGDDFWGFWMLGGMSGGGMGLILDPARKDAARGRIREILLGLKRSLQHSLPFSMDPVVYDFEINEAGSIAVLQRGEDALMPARYYPLNLPALFRLDPRELSEERRRELALYQRRRQSDEALQDATGALLENLFPAGKGGEAKDADPLDTCLERYGFDPIQHEAIRRDLRAGLIGLAQNRLPANARIEDVRDADVLDARLPGVVTGADREAGRAALAAGEVAVVTLAAGAGSRWTGGAGVVKGLHTFCKFGGRHRTFLEVHLAKSRLTGEDCGTAPAHVVTTSYLTHEPIDRFLAENDRYGYPGPLELSFGKSIGLRMVPMARDLRFSYEETPQQVLDERAQKVRRSLQQAMIHWAQEAGEGSDYRDNLPLQCLHPVGHWYEIPNLLLNGTLRRILKERPHLRTLLVHNIDTLGAHLDPGLLGLHRRTGNAVDFEVISRRLEDRGGGLARVDGRPRLVEGLALPHEEEEFKLRFYNTLTSWVDVDQLLAAFGLDRDEFQDEARIAAAVRDLSARLPTYITLKDVKKRWGHGQEDVFPVAQFEKLWGDISTLKEVPSGFFVVPRLRGQQLKEQAQLDGWLRDGSQGYVDGLCRWG
jgi:hypothetical protein